MLARPRARLRAVRERELERLRRLAGFYVAVARTAVQEQFQYRVANYAYMLGMITEPIVYLVVWSTVARSQGGSVGGYTPAQLAAYYIVWTLVRNVNIVFTPFGWEWRIREGTLSGMLLRPVPRSTLRSRSRPPRRRRSSWRSGART